MSNKKLTLSLIIPAYNEEGYLKACLDSIAEQSEMPDEVLVVDNNSTDQTAQIAKSYKFVTLLHETKQHQAFAQATGFNAAQSDILGRIDADTILPVNWVKNVKHHFAGTSKTVAVTGSTTPYDVAIKSACTGIFKFYINFAGRLAGHPMLWGANCALRRSAWLEVKDQVRQRGDIWEDFDMSFRLACYGQIKVVDDIDIGCSFRAIHKSYKVQSNYQMRAVRTFRLDAGMMKAAVLMSVWSTMLFVFVLTRIDKYVLKPLFTWIGDLRRRPEAAGEVASLHLE